MYYESDGIHSFPQNYQGSNATLITKATDNRQAGTDYTGDWLEERLR